jgi:predicted metal-dependent hydrolase
LNWRLVQVPESVRDYIILHELAHLREMNHSRRYWRVVEELCPNYREAEDYLRKHSGLLR